MGPCGLVSTVSGAPSADQMRTVPSSLVDAIRWVVRFQSIERTCCECPSRIFDVSNVWELQMRIALASW